MTKNSTVINDFLIRIEDNDDVVVMKKVNNVIDALRKISEKNGFEYDDNWNTRTFGAKIIKEFGEGDSASIDKYLINRLENDSIKAFELVDDPEKVLQDIAVEKGIENESLSVLQLANMLIGNTKGNTKTGKTNKYTLVITCNPWTIELWNCFGKRDLSNTDGFKCIEQEGLVPIADVSDINGIEEPDSMDWSEIHVYVTKEGEKEIELDQNDFAIGEVLDAFYDENKIKTPTTILWKIIYEEELNIYFELEIEGEFDPKKLKFIQKNYFNDTTSFPEDVSFILPHDIIYDGKKYTSYACDGGEEYALCIKLLSSDDNYCKTILSPSSTNWTRDDEMAVRDLIPE